MTQTLCETCVYCKEVVSGKGTRFLLCKKAEEDRRFHKYPPQPIIRCEGYKEPADQGGSS